MRLGITKAYTLVDNIVRFKKTRTWTGPRRYGTESEELARYARRGYFPHINPESVDYCCVCRLSLLANDIDSSSSTQPNIFLPMWELKWIDLSEANDYDEKILLVSGGVVPFQACGKLCCRDDTNTKK